MTSWARLAASTFTSPLLAAEDASIGLHRACLWQRAQRPVACNPAPSRPPLKGTPPVRLPCLLALPNLDQVSEGAGSVVHNLLQPATGLQPQIKPLHDYTPPSISTIPPGYRAAKGHGLFPPFTCAIHIECQCPRRGRSNRRMWWTVC